MLWFSVFFLRVSFRRFFLHFVAHATCWQTLDVVPRNEREEEKDLVGTLITPAITHWLYTGDVTNMYTALLLHSVYRQNHCIANVCHLLRYKLINTVPLLAGVYMSCTVRFWCNLTNSTRVGTLIVANIYLQLIQNRYIFRRFTVLQCSHQHCVQPVASDVEVVGYL